ncbi:MAG: hypothetical protein JO099_08095 [Acidobacteriia bacterium]|nr:hypothetical protein [Terriglobia bacterium]
MKKTLLAIGLAVATMPLTFAAQQPAGSTPNANSNASQSNTATAKKTSKKVKKNKTSKTTPAAHESTAAPSAAHK